MSLKPTFTALLASHSQSSGPQPTAKWHRAALHNSLTRATNTDPPDPSQKQTLITSLLKEIIRPAFSKSQPKNVTAQGRKAMESWRPAMPYDSEAVEAGKVWRGREAWVVDVFEWVLGELEESTVEEHWPMLIPPILAHVDDDTNATRVRGCAMLRRLLDITPTSLLTKTGLGDVFEEALLPHLVHLPPAFEEAEAIELLSATYSTLLRLVQVRFPKADKDSEETLKGRQKAYDKVLRQGVFTGLRQLTDNVEVSRVLLQQLELFLPEMGVLCVKHLKVMIPLISERLTSPFATAAPELMCGAARALLAVLHNAWPRVPYWSMEIIEAISMAFVRVETNNSPDENISVALGGVQSELAQELDALKTILKANDVDDGLAKCTRVLESNKHLAGLLEVWNMA